DRRGSRPAAASPPRPRCRARRRAGGGHASEELRDPRRLQRMRLVGTRLLRAQAGTREHLGGVGQPLGIEGAAHALHGVEVRLGEHHGHERLLPSPTPCSPVIEPPALTHSSRMLNARRSARPTWPSMRASYSTRGCRLPSPAWNTLATRSPACPLNRSISLITSGRAVRGMTPSCTM